MSIIEWGVSLFNIIKRGAVSFQYNKEGGRLFLIIRRLGCLCVIKKEVVSL